MDFSDAGGPMLALRMAVIGTLYLGTTLGLLPWLLLRTEAARGDFGPWKWLALLPLVLGAYITLRCGRDFARIGEGTPAPFDPRKKLVVQGLYVYVRNPMYAGMALILLSEAAFFASRRALLYTGAAVLVWHLITVFYEEPALRRKFGADFAEYCGRVPRWIPRYPRRDTLN